APPPFPPRDPARGQARDQHFTQTPEAIASARSVELLFELAAERVEPLHLPADEGVIVIASVAEVPAPLEEAESRLGRRGRTVETGGHVERFGELGPGG